MTNKIIFFILILSASLYGENRYYEDKISQFKILNEHANINITMLGDSITDGGLWSELTNRVDIANRGISGDTTKGLLSRVNYIGKSTKQVFIMIGINDIFRHIDVEEIFSNYIVILKKLKKQDCEVIVQSTLYIEDNFYGEAVNKKVTLLNEKLQKYCLKNKIDFIDLNSILSADGFLDKKYTNDGVHLNGLAYVLWVKTIKKYFVN